MRTGWATREADFEVLLRLGAQLGGGAGGGVGVRLRLVEQLGGEQRATLGRALASAPGEPEAVRLLEEAFAAAPRLPALRRGAAAAALGSCQRAAPLSLQGLPQDLQCPDRHLPGAAA